MNLNQELDEKERTQQPSSINRVNRQPYFEVKNLYPPQREPREPTLENAIPRGHPQDP